MSNTLYAAGRADPSRLSYETAEDRVFPPSDELQFRIAHAIYGKDGKYLGTILVKHDGNSMMMGHIIDNHGTQVPMGFQSVEEFTEFCRMYGGEHDGVAEGS